jgi:hypothetical protein
MSIRFIRRTLISFGLVTYFLLLKFVVENKEEGNELAKPLESHRSSTIVEEITELLEGLRGKKFYVYNNTNLTLPHIRAKSKDDLSKATWGRQEWARRFRPYAQGEVRFLEALEQYTNSDVRTFNIEEADFVVVPIPIGAAVFWGSSEDVSLAFRHLFNSEPFFKRHPERHLYLTNNERIFRGDLESLKHFRDCGLTLGLLVNIAKGILVKDFDAPRFQEYIINHPGGDWQNLRNITRPLFQHQWSLGYSHESSDSKYPFIDVANFQHWIDKNNTFFYYTPEGGSLNNSTIYRHALVTNGEGEKLVQPSSVGFNTNHTKWLSDFQNSKYCVVVRGDNPTTRSLFTAIRLGCMPVIVSDALPMYQPIFQSLLGYEDFSIVVDEAAFLLQPARTLNNAIKLLSFEELKSKISGLALVQRMLVIDHPRSLFVPAFVHETVTRQLDYFPYLFMENSSTTSLRRYELFASQYDLKIEQWYHSLS